MGIHHTASGEAWLKFFVCVCVFKESAESASACSRTLNSSGFLQMTSEVYEQWIVIFKENYVQGSEYRMGTGQHPEVQEQCKQHMPTEEATEHWAAEGARGREAATPALNMGKFGEQGQWVKKSQQESSLDDRRNLISKIHKSSSEGRHIMGTKEASVRVNTVLLLAIKWIRPSC